MKDWKDILYKKIKNDSNYNNLKQNIMLEKYKQNLRIDGDKVWSYTTHVATISGSKLFQLGYWSMTTQKHINYVANQLDLDLVKNKFF